MSTCHSLLKLRFSAFLRQHIPAIMKKKEKIWHCENSNIHLFPSNNEKQKKKLFPSFIISFSFPYSFDAFWLYKVEGEVNFTTFSFIFHQRRLLFSLQNCSLLKILLGNVTVAIKMINSNIEKWMDNFLYILGYLNIMLWLSYLCIEIECWNRYVD